MSTWSYVVEPVAATAAETSDDVGPLSQVSDHGSIAVARLLEQFRGRPRIEDLVNDVVSMLQPLEDLCWQLLQERYLFTVNGQGPAEGVQLDNLGILLGEPRAGRLDAEYRNFLQIRILVNNSDGNWRDIHGVLDLFDFTVVTAEEIYPAHIWIETADADYGYDYRPYLVEAKAAGVGLTLIVSSYTSANTFTFSSTYGAEETDASQGFGGEYVATGGRIAGVAQ